MFEKQRVDRETTAGRKSMMDLKKNELELLTVAKNFSVLHSQCKKKFMHLRPLFETCRVTHIDNVALRLMTHDLIAKMEGYEKFLKTNVKQGRLERVLSAAMAG